MLETVERVVIAGQLLGDEILQEEEIQVCERVKIGFFNDGHARSTCLFVGFARSVLC